MNFKERVARHLQAYQDAHALTNQQVADLLELEKGSYVAMLKHPTDSNSPMALKLLQRMCQAFCLTPLQAARLILARAKFHPDSATAIDVDVLGWTFRTLRLAGEQLRSGGGAAA